ncbi:MAG TPA: AMP-binding protein [Clostridia bacterium]|jgi:long-chain acyl-CoA synthetase|nr:AMP-binding protein [Clostridiaceae bacterium]HPZ51815.1 AMP-binding protein [Clostridia bacterium]
MKNIPLYEVDQISTLKDMIINSEKKFGDKPAFLKKVPGIDNYVPVTYKQYKKDVDALGTKLIDLGYKDEKIVIIGENRYEWSCSYLAVVNGVGVVVPLDKELPENEIELSVNRAEASLVIFSPKLIDKIDNLYSKLPTVKEYIVMDDESSDDRFVAFGKLLKDGHELLDKGDDRFTSSEIDPEEMKILLFTSGTTDVAKAVMLSHRNICENLMAMCSMTYIDENDVFLSILPIHHTYECTCGFLCPLYRGSTVAYCEGLRHIAKNMAEAKVTIVLGVPLVFESMYKKIWDGIRKAKQEKKVRFAIRLNNFLKILGMDKSKNMFEKIHASFGGHLRLLISGAAAIDPEVAKGFRDLGILFIQGYGLTECAPIVALNRNVDFKDAAAGLPMPGVDIVIDNPDENGIGEIIVKGPNVMLGYYKDEAATKQVIDSKGYFHTGDLGYMDKEKFVYITGRKKNVIVTKNGKNIFPEEIEYLLLKSPYIQEVLVYASDEAGDTIVKANIFPNFEKIEEDFKNGVISSDNVEAIIQSEIKNVNKQLVNYKSIRGFNIRETEFSKTTTRKIKRYVEENKAEND